MTQKHTSRTMPTVMWALAATFYFYEFLLQVSPSVMVPDMMRSFSVNAAVLGVIASLYFYAYAGMQIPVGIFYDRFGPRRLLTAATGICTIGCLIFSLAPSIYILGLGRLLIGFGSAFAVVGCMTIAAHWFSPKRFATLTGLMVTVGMLGATCGQAPLAILVDHVGWRFSILVFAVIGIVLAVCMYAIIRDNTKHHKHISSQEFFAGLKHVAKSKQTWLTSIYGGLMFAPTSAFAALWGTPCLVSIHHLERSTAAFIVSLIFIGWAVGCPLFGWLSDKIQRRKPLMYLGSVCSCILFATAIYVNLTPFLLGLSFFLFGFFSSAFVLAFSIVKEITPNESTATALGFINMLNMIGGAVAQPLIGYMLDNMWQGKMLNHARIFSPHAYQVALALLPVCLLLAVILLPTIKETYCREIKPNR